MALQLTLASTASPNTQTILAWPCHGIGRIRQEVLVHYGKSSGSPDGSAILAAGGLMNCQGQWTELGHMVSDLLIHETWQQGDEVQGLLHDHLDVLRGAVLDVGCATGWTLRQIRHAARRVGVDTDEDALALGYRLAEAEGEAVEFRSGSAHALPFDESTFDCVIARNVLTYTRQEQALREMTRVLKRSGLLFLRYENFRYDIQRLLHSPGSKAWCCCLRDFAHGMLYNVLGWQHPPGMPLAPGRVFGSTHRIGQLLKSGHCYPLHVMDSLECPRFLGRASQTSLLACKL